MASVLFSTIGQAVGGPLGAAVGAAVGGSVDSLLFGARRRGTAELFVQRSAYGEILPRLYGRTRAAGQLIWALPIKGAAGKGSGRRDSGASFAIALSSGPIQRVGRIWADGREIRDSSGRFEARTQMRVHAGGLDQVADPLIVAAEGAENALAYPGLAYVLFEDFALAPFGNRIPNLSFEIFADAAGPAQWLDDLAGQAGITVEADEVDPAALGYAAFEGGLEEAARIGRIGDLSVGYVEGGARFRASPPGFDLRLEDLLASDEGAVNLARGDRPSAMALTYLDSDRDYQPGRQRVARARRGRELESEAPVCATAGMALSLAARFLRQSEVGADRLRFGLSWRWLGIGVGDHVRIEGLGAWRILEREVRGLRLFCEAERAESGAPSRVGVSDPGRVLPAPVVPAGSTDVHLFEVPVPLRAGASAAWVWMGGGAGWRGARASLLSAGGESLIGEVREASPRGWLAAPLEAGQEAIWDWRNSLLLEVEEGARIFESRSRAEVLAGANLLRVGEELIQYCEAVVVAANRVRLSGLLRGRFGTGFRSRRLEVGEIVRLVEVDRILPVGTQGDMAGRSLLVLASGAGDPVGGTEAGLTVEGLAASPIAPVHVTVRREPDGGLTCNWAPRSAANWHWDAAEGAHAGWRCHILSQDGRSLVILVREQRLYLGPDQQAAAFGAMLQAGTMVVEVLGDGPPDLRMSRPLVV
ncbi:phage tail protein [Sandaracinobacter sp. RS1-74]|uniref:phage tail protein n=1 Tax=Sandaracinobacteroides sayramensis TaxID=2913411 RepID=UPI001EDC094B|nr:phage tail protein [Sandaracinobacteroides sayramensis]MCG2839752.1 phage tail protein [Sandaracinobacteroides sayramensis]